MRAFPTGAYLEQELAMVAGQVALREDIDDMLVWKLELSGMYS